MSSAGSYPRVSVVIGAFNCAATLDEAIGSLVAQTYPHWDLVVCDDASTDETLTLLLDWQRRIPERITLLCNESNRKLSYTLNRCLAEATGDLIARMDADDVSEPDRFERQVAYLADHPEIDLVGTWMQRFSAAGLADVVSPPERPDRWTLRSRVPFCHATILARREVYDTLEGYVDSPRLERCEDRDLWFRFFAKGLTGHNLPEPLYLVREDLAAIRRRTLRSRVNDFRTTVAGFTLLEYPRRSYIRPALALAKAFVPARGVAVYRTFQKWWFDRRVTA